MALQIREEAGERQGGAVLEIGPDDLGPDGQAGRGWRRSGTAVAGRLARVATPGQASWSK